MKGSPRSMARALAVNAPITRLRIPINAKQINMTDPGAAAGWGTFVAGGLPEGNLILMGMMAYLKLTKVSGGLGVTFTPTISVGTAATADNALAGAEVNMAPAVAQAAAAAGVTGWNRVASTATESGLTVDNTDKTLNVNVNITVPDADITAAAVMEADGYVDLVCIVLGDD